MRVALACLVLGAALLPAVALASGGPLVDAGLDQHVGVGDTVHLDAGGTTDPGAGVVAYRWRVRGPDGHRIPTACDACVRTTFTPVRAGRYVVTLNATGADGETGTDSLRVTVGRPRVYSGSTSGPTLRLDGPTHAAPNDTVDYRATATAGVASLDAVVWRIDGRVVGRDTVSGRNATVSLVRRFGSAGTHRVNATVVDEANRTAARNHTVHLVRSGSWGYVPRGPVVLLGPRRLTGSAPFRATYRVNRTGNEYTDWYLDGRRVGHGGNVTLSLSPGIHHLHAERGTSQGVVNVTFPGNGTRVVADPGPALDATVSATGGGVAVTAVARDRGRDLRTVSVTIDGHRVTTHALDGPHGWYTGRWRLSAGAHRVVVTVADASGGRDTATRTVTVPPDGAAWRLT